MFDMLTNNPLFARGGRKSDVQNYIGKILDGMDIDTAISGFVRLGVEGDDLINILGKCGFESELVKEKVLKLGSTGSRSVVGLKDAFSGLLTVMKPVLATAASLMVAFAGYKLFDYLVHTIDRMDESLASLKDDLSSVEEEMKNLESESGATKDRLKELYELKDKGPLTFTEEEELRNLEAQNRELERKIELLKLERDLKQSEISKTFTDTMTGDLNSQHVSKDNFVGFDVKVQDGMETLSPVYDTEINYIEKQFEKYKSNLAQIAKEEESYKQQIADAQKAGNEARANELLAEQKKATAKYEAENKTILAYLDERKTTFEERSSGLSYLEGDNLTAEQQEFNKQLAYIEDFVDRRAILLGSDGAKTHAIYRLMDTTFAETTNSLRELGEQGKVTAEDLKAEQYQEFIDKLIDIGVISDKTDGSLSFIAAAFNKVTEQALESGDSASNAAKSYSDMATAVSDLKSELSTLNSAASEQGYSGNITPETYDALIAKSKDYASCIEYQNGALQLNTEKANALFEAKSELQIAELELQKIADATKWKENADEIERLTKEYDGLDGAIKDQIENLKKENAGIEANLVGYDIQIAAIEELTSAYGRWKAVSESDNSDSMYKDIQKAYEQIKEAQKAGQTGVGNVVYQAAVELLVPDGRDVSKYMDTLKRYITEDASGLSNFITDMLTANLMTQAGDKVELVAGTTIDDICEALTITPEMAKSIFNALEMYEGWDFNWDDADFNIDTSALEEVEARISEIKAQIEAIKTGDDTVEIPIGVNLEQLESDLATAEAKRNEILGTTGSSGQNEITYTVDANTEAANKALESIQEKLEEIAKKISSVASKSIGDLGGIAAASILGKVYNQLVKINEYQIQDKSFTVTQYNATSGGGGTKMTMQAKAEGTNFAQDGVALLGDERSLSGAPRPELVITDGAAYVAGQNGPEIVNLKRGDQVIPADETKRILSGNPDARKNIIPAFAGGKDNGSLQDMLAIKKAATNAAIAASQAAKAAEQTSKINIDNGTFQDYIAVKKQYGSASSTSPTISGGGDPGKLSPGKGTPGSGGGSKGSGGSGGSGSSGGSGGSGSSSSSEKSQFEKDYDYHQHLLAMEQESQKDYLAWLDKAYQDAYRNNEIEYEDYLRYKEEVFQGQKDLFMDGLNDIEHKISILEREPNNERQIINLYQKMIADLDSEIVKARARGLTNDDEYLQELLDKRYEYVDEIADIEDELAENAKDAIDDLVDYRIEMLKKEIENEKDAINDKLSALKDFYDEQKQMLQDARDEEDYLEQQQEKRKSVDDIKAEIDMLQFDDSAKTQKRLKELEEELKEAEKELSDFEKDRAFEDATKLLDKMYEQQESQMQSEIDALDQKLNDPNALYNQALNDIQNNTLALYEEMVEYNNKYGSGNAADIYDRWDSADKALDAYFKAMGQAYKDILLVNAYKPEGYASGTDNATPGIHELFEKNKDEYVFQASDGRRYKMFSGLGSKVLNASATNFLYKFANNGEAFISNMIDGLVGAVGSVGKPVQQIQLSTGDIIVTGNANSDTVSAIRRAQRENIDHVLREFVRLNR